MTYKQEEALYDFLDNTAVPFELDEVVNFIHTADSTWSKRLANETAAFLDFRHIAFNMGGRQWISRRGCFESASFVINPTKVELLNGILIPGHRCVPFANPELLPQEYVFSWEGAVIPVTTTEGEPEEFYPYYSIFGEEYAPQYVARDNPVNETAFNSDPYDDPAEVSIHTLDMRNVYRETSFVPGDRFVARVTDWRQGFFSLERISGDEWRAEDLFSWLEAAEAGFEDSFNRMGPGSSTEEQIACAYWFGGKRMREAPAYSLEEFLYEKSDRIETAPYGIETRFWYAGREIPDLKGLDDAQGRPDRTDIEELLWSKQIPVSEYVIQSYARDFLFRKEVDIAFLINRIVPAGIELTPRERRYLEDYLYDALGEFQADYNPFRDSAMGPIRQRVGELHTAVIELAARLSRGGVDSPWLPKYTFIALSQIQNHAAAVLEDLDTEEAPPDEELETMDNSLDSMVETYEDIRELIKEALENYRRNKLVIVKPGGPSGDEGMELIQFSIGGADVWRRILVNENCRLDGLHRIIQIVFGWEDAQPYRFSAGTVLENDLALGELAGRGNTEFLYEYGAKWTVRVIFLSRGEDREDKRVRCVAGEGAAPPEHVDGPLRFRRFLSALEGGNEKERRAAEEQLGGGFRAGVFDMDACNSALKEFQEAAWQIQKQKTDSEN
jgi:hypothetical protein